MLSTFGRPARRALSSAADVLESEQSQINITHRALRVYGRLLRLVLDSVDDAVLVLDRDGDYVLANLPFERLSGLRRGDPAAPSSLAEAFSALGAAIDERVIVELLGEPRAASTTLELRGGRAMLCSSAPLTLDAPGDYRLLTLRDVTLEQRELRALEHRALHDRLTALPNRDLLLDRLAHALSRQARHGDPVGVIFLDLDGFKSINDRYGHASGDLVLSEVGKRLQREMRQADTVGRLGGDEFMVVCDGVAGEDELAAICVRIRDAISQPFRLQGEIATLSASIGAVLEWNYDAAPRQVIARADALMYRAKRAGSEYEIATAGRAAGAEWRSHGGQWLREALDEARLQLAYLPVVSIADRGITAVEGLLRCTHPQLVGYSPVQLIELAAELGLLQRLDEWLLDEAAAASRKLLDLGGTPIPVFVNVSETQLADEALPAAVTGAAGRHQVPIDALGFDVPESVILAGQAGLEQRLGSLKALGCRLAADDVTGPTVAAELLAELGFTAIKLDQSVIDGAVEGEAATAAARALVARASALGITPIAEGVDDERRLHAAIDLGCDVAQGYGFYGFPRPLGELAALIAEAAG